MTETNQNPVNGQHKRSRKGLYISMLCALLVTAAIGFTHFNTHNGGDHWGKMIDMVTKDMTLSDQQKTQIQGIKDEIKAKHEDMKKNRDQQKSGAEDFENLFRQDNISKQDLVDLQTKREKAHADMQSFMMDEIVKFHSVLTPDQRNQVADKIKDMRQHAGDWKKKHDKDQGPGQNN